MSNGSRSWKVRAARSSANATVKLSASTAKTFRDTFPKTIWPDAPVAEAAANCAVPAAESILKTGDPNVPAETPAKAKRAGFQRNVRR